MLLCYFSPLRLRCCHVTRDKLVLLVLAVNSLCAVQQCQDMPNPAKNFAEARFARSQICQKWLDVRLAVAKMW